MIKSKTYTLSYAIYHIPSSTIHPVSIDSVKPLVRVSSEHHRHHCHKINIKVAKGS